MNARVARFGLSLIITFVAAWMLPPSVAEGINETCGMSDGHFLCVIVPTFTISGRVKITITSDPNDGRVIATWVPRGRPAAYLITQFAPSPETGDYSFIWPTRKYLDGSGNLRVQHGSTFSSRVAVPVSLKNGNTSHIQHTPKDWRTFLPGTWTAVTDPVVAAVGDGPSDETTSNEVAQSIAAANPALFLFLGDIYEQGTFTENLNHYGNSALDSPFGPSLWGVMARITQPTVGNHDEHLGAWKDYWHGRPTHMAFTFGGVLFLDLDAMQSFAVGSAQHRFVKNKLSTAPRCVVAFWHHPVLWDDVVNPDRRPIWKLLANRGGDLVVNGHQHSMAAYLPLNADFQLGGHLVELVSGAGGHQLGGPGTDSSGRLQWTPSQGGQAGVLYLTLNGAAGGGTATSISWEFRDPQGDPYAGSSGSVTC
jgi:Calcineurin-like phosphoesterase